MIGCDEWLKMRMIITDLTRLNEWIDELRDIRNDRFSIRSHSSILDSDISHEFNISEIEISKSIESRSERIFGSD